MSYMKRFLEDVMERMGRDEIDQAVLDQAQFELDHSGESEPESDLPTDFDTYPSEDDDYR